MRVAILAVLVLGCSHSSGSAGGGGGHTPDALPAGSFACGANVCSDKQFCYQISVGATAVVGSAAEGCNDDPATCTDAGDCACVMAGATFSCNGGMSCNVIGGNVFVDCAYP